MPVGVKVTTDVLQPSGGPDTTAAATFMLSGVTERGDTTAPIEARNATEWRQKVGNRVLYGAADDQVIAYFGEGGSHVVFARRIGTAAVKGNVTAQDRAGTPVNTVRFDAQNAGAWSADVDVDVADGLVADSVTLTVLLDGEQVEQYPNLTSIPAIVTALAASQYVRAADLGSATAAPGNLPAVDTYTLSAGSDDRGSIDAAGLITALNTIGPDYGPGMVAIPGQPYSSVAAGIAAHCVANRRIGAVAAVSGANVSTVTAAARTLRTSQGADSVGFFYPWVQIPDGAGGLTTISPEGFVAGVRARNIIASGGVMNAPFGEAGRSRFVVSAATTLTGADADTLADGAVNPIRNMLGGVRLYDWRSLSVDEANWKFLSYRDVINAIAAELADVFESFVGRNIDGRGHLFAEMENTATSIVEPYRRADALYELRGPDDEMLDPGYSTSTASPINTPQSIQAGQAHIQVKVRPAPEAEQVDVGIFKASLTNTL